VCFVAVNAVNAQTPAPTATASKKEASATPAASAAKETPAMAGHSSCCQKGASAKSCCKAGGETKACTPAEKAKCAEKMKAEASTPASDKKPGSN
jgi:hypothetical protein